jgi:hypothetical protein
VFLNNSKFSNHRKKAVQLRIKAEVHSEGNPIAVEIITQKALYRYGLSLLAGNYFLFAWQM